MRWSKTFIPTLNEDPADAEVISHKLLVRAGFIRQISRGIYDYLPLGLKVIRKIENIVREEMDRAGAQELLLPIAPGVVYHAWTFNGTVPGPVIRVHQGQTIHFTLVNGGNGNGNVRAIE